MIKKKRILFTIPNFKTAGSQYVLLSILRNLNLNNFEPFVMVERFPKCFPKDIPQDKRLLINRSNNLIKDVFAYTKLLRKHKIDIVHSWDYKSDFTEAIACKLCAVPYIYTKKNNAWSKRWQLKSVLSKYVAYDNPEMKNRFFNTWYFKHKISFIPHGVNLNNFKPLAEIQHNEFNLCCVGNINSNKNQKFILEALVKLPKQVHAHFYGNEDENYRKLLDEYVDKHNLETRVHFHGYIKNSGLPMVYQKQDLFVLPSFNEGFPVCLLEAMACGIPVLSSNSGGGATYMLKQNKGGYVFNLQDSNDFIKKIQLLMQDSEFYQKCKIEAVNNVTAHFSMTREVEAYDSLYLKILNIK